MGTCHGLWTQTLFRRQHVPYKTQKNPEAAKPSGSGGVKISRVQELGSRECVCLNERIWTPHCHINPHTILELCTPFGLSYFSERGSLCQDKTEHKRSSVQWAVGYIYMLVSLVVLTWSSAVYPFKMCNKIWVHIYFYAPPSGPVKSNPQTSLDYGVYGLKLPRASPREISPVCV